MPSLPENVADRLDLPPGKYTIFTVGEVLIIAGYELDDITTNPATTAQDRFNALVWNDENISSLQIDLTTDPAPPEGTYYQVFAPDIPEPTVHLEATDDTLPILEHSAATASLIGTRGGAGSGSMDQD